MIRDFVGLLTICAALYAAPYLSKIDAWRDACGAGVMITGAGGVYIQTKKECEQ